MITLQKDTDILVLLKLNDTDLVKICSLNRLYRNICNDDNFWRLKVVNYIGKKQEKHNMQLHADDIDEIIKIDYKMIEDTKFFLEFHTWKEFYIFLVENKVNIYYFRDTNFFSNVRKYDEKKLPNWINSDKFYVKYKRLSFLSEERNALSYMVDELREVLFDSTF